MTREHYDQLLQDLDAAILEMGHVVTRTIATCVDTLERGDVQEAERLVAADDEIDEKRYDIENQALLLIATQQPLARDLRTVAAILTIATELERIGDYCEGIAKLTLRMASEPMLGSLPSIRSMAEVTTRLLLQSLQAFKDRDLDAAGAVWKQDDEVDDLYEEIYRHLIADMVLNPATVRRGTYLLWVAHNVERMADRVTNIAERVAFVVAGDVTVFREDLKAQMLPR